MAQQGSMSYQSELHPRHSFCRNTRWLGRPASILRQQTPRRLGALPMQLRVEGAAALGGSRDRRRGRRGPLPAAAALTTKPRIGGSGGSGGGTGGGGGMQTHDLDSHPAKVAEGGASSTKAAEAAYAEFQWAEQWYPVAFVQDLPEGQLTQVTLFDQQYVVVRRPAVTHADGSVSGGSPAVLLDRCPHRAAALSQGLLTPDGLIQCAYHGWKLDGDTGACKEIPQLPPGAKFSSKTSGTAFPVLEHQGMVWMRPSGDPRTVDSAPDSLNVLPELDDLKGWTSDDFVRDFDIDYTLLLENLADPDHGLFAHQVSYFDSYTANADMPMALETGATHQRPTITGSVPGVLKFTRKPEEHKSQERALFSEKEQTAGDMRATIQFEAPGLVRWSRFDKEGKTTFITAFYAVPTGVGRSRLLIRYARAVAPWFNMPRWLFGIFLNSFLDQDSFLLATQQPVTLEAELRGLLAAQERDSSAQSHKAGDKAGSVEQEAAPDAQLFPAQRRRLYCYRAPSEGLLIQIGRWIDTAVPRMPHRAQLLLAAHDAGGSRGGVIGQPRREDILDRWTCHTQICPDSMAAYRRLAKLRTVFGAAAGLGALTLLSYAFSMTAAGNAWGGAQLAGAAASIASAAAAFGAAALMRQFHYVYTPEKSRKDLAKIPKLTSHLSHTGTP